ncbi:alpha/beta fold hydrolase [Kangiella spongicola]|uniref:Alpha/beta hydrolase n=1 Tax=Kangiella spongicola TaxID=796379 RepID=A0A318D4N9_9GAMM|nr:alpha/beta hydrolase [Kangiella spongicola]MBV34266.1 alpha/beta hydrolase [Rickettsiales bacterium]PXF62818.1 alpha/beta hydrolase [Kangiella spongicola]
MHFTFDREYQLEIQKNKISVVEWGNPEGEPVLCLHGWLDNAATFHFLAPLLTNNTNYRLIAIEFPGHGQSEHLHPAADYQFISGISIIDCVIDILKLEKPKLLAHSMGAALSTIYAGVFPDKIDSIVSIDALGALVTSPENTIKQLAKALEQRRAKRSRKRYFKDLETAAKARAQVSELPVDILLPLIERGVTLCEDGYQWSSDSRLKHLSWLRLTEAQMKVIMETITCPVLVIMAKEGLYEEYPEIEKRFDYLKNVKRVDLDGGHHLHMQFADNVAEEIIKFWSNS